MAKLLFPEDGYLFDTHTDLQNTFIKKIHTEGTASALEWMRIVKNGIERSYQNRLTLTWEPSGAEQYELELLEEGADAPRVFKTAESSLELDNLKIGARYLWRVDGGEWRSFTTKGDSPRFIRIEGALNVRDIGGINIKQGLVYRGSALEDYSITEGGKKTFKEELGIKTDIDLRAECPSDTEISPAGEGVRRVHLPYRPYDEVFEEQHRRGIVKIMNFLADESIYPVYVHCLGGADRTGMIALYLRAILGECDDDIHTDYELTALSTYALGAAEGADGFRSRESDYYVEFLTMLRGEDKDAPLSVAVPRFLSSCGVSEETLDRIRKILRK